MFFGQEAKLSAQKEQVYAELENEPELMRELRIKLGPSADEKRLQHQLRASGGKIHWAVNCYFRELFNVPSSPKPAAGSPLDFQSRHALTAPPPQQQQQQQRQQPTHTAPDSGQACSSAPTDEGTSAAAAQISLLRVQQLRPADSCSSGGSSSSGSSLSSIPISLLEEIFGHLDAWSVCQVARVNRAFNTAASSSALWEGLFRAEWGGVVFPTEPKLSQLQQQQQQQQQQQPPGIVPALADANHAAGGAGGGGGAGEARGATGPAAGAGGSVINGGYASEASGSIQNEHLAVEGSIAEEHWAGEDGQPESPHAATMLHSRLPGLGLTAAAAAAAAIAAGVSEGLVTAGDTGSWGSEQVQPCGCSSNGGCGGSAASSVPPALLPQPSASGSACCPRSGLASDPANGVPHDANPSRGPHADASAETDPSASDRPPSRASSTPQPVCWRSRFRKQALLVHTMTCPRCGNGRIVPILYGFPSPWLLAAMGSKRLILGGDHLIQDCHVWVCTACNSSFRAFPYLPPYLDVWIAACAKEPKPGSTRHLPGHQLYTYEL